MSDVSPYIARTTMLMVDVLESGARLTPDQSKRVDEVIEWLHATAAVLEAFKRVLNVEKK